MEKNELSSLSPEQPLPLLFSKKGKRGSQWLWRGRKTTCSDFLFQWPCRRHKRWGHYWPKPRALLNSTNSLSDITESRKWKIPLRVLAFHHAAKKLEAGEGRNWPQGYKALLKIIAMKIMGWIFLQLHFFSFPLHFNCYLCAELGPGAGWNFEEAILPFCYLPHCSRKELQQMRQMHITYIWSHEWRGGGWGGEGNGTRIRNYNRARSKANRKTHHRRLLLQQVGTSLNQLL